MLIVHMAGRRGGVWRAVISAMVLAPLMLVAAHAAEDFEFAEGIEYERIEPPVTGVASNEVVELFWYTCPHCYTMDPMVKRWLEDKPEAVTFRKMPAVFNNGRGQFFAKVFYAAESLDVLERIHLPLFRALHDENRQLRSIQQVADFMVEHGVEREEFLRAFDSFVVDMRVRQAMQFTERSGIGGVPSFVIGGRYRTAASMTGSYGRTFAVAEYLAQR